MEQTNMVLSAFQTMAAQGMIPKTGKAGDKAAGNFQKLLDQKAQSSAPKKDASVEQKPKTDAVNKEEAPIQEESALEKAKKLAEQGYAIVQFNVGCVQIDPETGEVIAEYEPKEYLLAFNGTDHEIIPIGNMPAWERAQLDQLVSDFKTIDVSDPEADAMLEATDPNAKYTVAELLEKYGNEQMGKVSGQAVEEINPQQKEGEKVEIVDVDQGPQQLFHDVEAAPIKVGETYTEQPVDEANVVGQVDAQLAVEQQLAVQLDLPPVRAADARDALEGRALPAAGGSQQRQDLPASGGEVHIQEKIPVPLFDPHCQRHFPASFRSRRFTASSTAAEMARFTSTHRRASASCPVRQSW